MNERAKEHCLLLISEILLWAAVVVSLVSVYGCVRADTIKLQEGKEVPWYRAINYKTEVEK